MKIFDGELTQAQIDAGLSAMKGEFDFTKVVKALREAGVTNIVSGAEVLIGRELRLGHLRRVTQGIFEKVDG